MNPPDDYDDDGGPCPVCGCHAGASLYCATCDRHVHDGCLEQWACPSCGQAPKPLPAWDEP